VFGDDAHDDGEPDAGAGELIHTVQPLEYSEQLVVILHVETHAVVADRIHGVVGVFSPCDLDPRRGGAAAVFHRVADEVYPDLFQERRVAQARRQSPDDELGGGLRTLHDLVDTLAHQRLHVVHGRRDRPAPEAGECQQILDERAHALAAVAHHAQQPQALRIQH